MQEHFIKGGGRCIRVRYTFFGLSYPDPVRGVSVYGSSSRIPFSPLTIRLSSFSLSRLLLEWEIGRLGTSSTFFFSSRPHSFRPFNPPVHSRDQLSELAEMVLYIGCHGTSKKEERL